MIYWLGGLLAGIALLILGIASNFGVAVTLWWVGALIIGALFTGLFLLMPVPALLSEWKFFVDGQASAGAVAFDHIVWALQHRKSPLDVVQVRRLKLAGGEGRDYLEMAAGCLAALSPASPTARICTSAGRSGCGSPPCISCSWPSRESGRCCCNGDPSCTWHCATTTPGRCGKSCTVSRGKAGRRCDRPGAPAGPGHRQAGHARRRVRHRRVVPGWPQGVSGP